MELAWTVLLGLVALGWVVLGTRSTIGMFRVPRVAEAQPLADDECPMVSILVAARNEAEKLPGALASWLSLDYPRYEIVAVNDRSSDGTGELLNEAARRNPRLKVIHVSELPPGWLGKPHALQTAFQQGRGDWLLFTDADVHFAPDLLRRAGSLARESAWDHLTLVGGLEIDSAGEKIVLPYFALAFVHAVEPWGVGRRGSRRYCGVGAFQLLRRSVYEAVGTHRRLAMEVVDDMKLGRLVKEGGFASGVALGDGKLHVRWVEGLDGIIRAMDKNAFAATGYSVWLTLGGVAAIWTASVLPFLALPWVTGTAQLFAAVAVVLAILRQGLAAWATGVSPLYGLTHPLGGLLFGYIMLRSMALTLWRGGVVWRETFYPLDELRKRMV